MKQYRKLGLYKPGTKYGSDFRHKSKIKQCPNKKCNNTYTHNVIRLGRSRYECRLCGTNYYAGEAEETV
jgi:hypothetical protein